MAKRLEKYCQKGSERYSDCCSNAIVDTDTGFASTLEGAIRLQNQVKVPLDSNDTPSVKS